MAKYSVSYVYEIVDKYSKTIDKISRKTKSFAHDASKATMQASLSFQKFGKKLGAIGAKMSVISAPILLLGRNMINAASDAEETSSKYATVFQTIGDEAEKTADRFAKSFGLAGSTSRQLLGDTGDMLSGFGFTSQAALKLSERTNSLAVDLASFTNFSGGAEGASAALTKALLGERESVKSLGIAILESDVKKKVSQMRSQGVRFATEREAKAYATLEIAISQSKNAIGDYARTKESFANTQRRVMQRNLEMRESFGKILIPVATKAMLVIEELQEKFINLSPSMKKAIIIGASLFVGLTALILAFSGIALVLPMVTAGFWLMVASITALSTPIVAFMGLGLGVYLGKLLFKIESVTQAWNDLKATLSGKGFLEGLSAIGENLHVAVTHGVLGEEAGQRAASKITNRRNVAVDGAVGKDGANGTVTVKAEEGTSITDILGTGLKGAIGMNMAGDR